MQAVLQKFLMYLGFRKPDPEAPSSFNLKLMHGINKISILVFFVAIIIFIIKVLSR